MCLSEFIPDKISGVALEYRPRESAILEEDEEHEETSISKITVGRFESSNGKYKPYKVESL